MPENRRESSQQLQGIACNIHTLSKDIAVLNCFSYDVMIEADNYHFLQLMEYLYADKVECIYIDPPYNTGAQLEV